MAKNTGSNAKWGEAPKSTWIDISIPFRNNMVHWPTDPVPHVKRLKDRNAGDDTTLTEMQWIDHVGTHVDAPLPFIKNGKTIDKMPLNATIGRTRVIEIKNPVSITLKELAPHAIRRGERILFKTQNSVKCYKSDAFVEDYVYFDTDVAQYLADKGGKGGRY
jgi:arylformamidase